MSCRTLLGILKCPMLMNLPIAYGKVLLTPQSTSLHFIPPLGTRNLYAPNANFTQMNKFFLSLISFRLFHQQTPSYLKLTRKPVLCITKYPTFHSDAVIKHPTAKVASGKEGFIQSTVPGHSPSLWGNQGRHSKHHIHSRKQRERKKKDSLFTCLLTLS